MNRIPLIIDSDTGIDDAIAIAVALFDKKFDVKLISCVFGNLDIDSILENNLNLISALSKSEVVVAKGSGINYSKNSLNFSAHGRFGLGEYEFDKHDLKPSKLSSVEAMHKVMQLSPVPVTILATGPLSNIYELLKKYPHDKDLIERVVICGGLIETLKDGQSPYLSFNIAVDTEAFKYVINSGVKFFIAPSNLGHETFFDWKDVYKIKITNKTGAMFEKIFRSYKDRHVKNGIATHDLCALLYVGYPNYFESTDANVYVEDFEGLGVLKFNFSSTKPNTMVAVKGNSNKLKKIFFRALKKMPR